MSALIIRRADVADAERIAPMHVASWRETYRGVMTDAVLDDPDAVAKREHFWAAALTDPKYAENRIAVAELDGVLVGVAMSGPSLASGDRWGQQLHVLYVLKHVHGSGAGAKLLHAVLDPAQPAVLWVADPNPRAQAFYRKHGFETDGGEATDFGVREIRMVRDPGAPSRS